MARINTNDSYMASSVLAGCYSELLIANERRVVAAGHDEAERLISRAQARHYYMGADHCVLPVNSSQGTALL